MSNLSFVAKLVEKCVFKQLNCYLNKNNLISKRQSGCRKIHSCETAMTRVHNDLILGEQGSHSLLVLLDLSSAFDTWDHETLIKTLRIS